MLHLTLQQDISINAMIPLNEGSSKENVLTTMTTKGLILTLYCCYFNLALTKSQYQEELSFWNTAKPGELLKTLDAVTSSTQNSMQPKQLEKQTGEDLEKPQLQRRISEGSAESIEEKSPYDYDKAYEEFVKKYFDDSVTDALSASDSSENIDNEQHDAETYSGEEVESVESNEPVIEASKKSATKAEKCKRVERGQQNCLICKNPRNGETSESCSYNKESKPQSYAFEKQKNYRKYRATPKTAQNEDSTEHVASAKTSASLRKPIIRLPNKSNDTLSCTMTKTKNKICYYCENSKGEEVTKCFLEEIPFKSNKNDEFKVPNSKLQKSHQRVYKRTISYTYEKSPNDVNNNTEILEEKPLIEKHFILKELNGNER